MLIHSLPLHNRDEEIKNLFIRPLKRYGIVLKTFLFPS